MSYSNNDLLVDKINKLTELINNNQVIFLYVCDSINLLNNNIKKLTYFVKENIKINNEIQNITDIAFQFIIDFIGELPVLLTQYNNNYNIPAILAKDRNNVPLSTQIVYNNIDINTLGTYNITYQIVNSNGYIYGTYTKQVYVVVNGGPTITISGANPLEVDVFSDINSIDFTAFAIDNYDISLNVDISTNLNLNVVGNYQVIYSAIDSNNNISTYIRHIYVNDNIPPV